MAIILEQEKKSLPIATIATIVLIAGIVLASVYYLFINKPEVVNIIIPTATKQITEIARAGFSPEELLESPGFTRLKIHTGMPTPAEGTVGKANPFAP